MTWGKPCKVSKMVTFWDLKKENASMKNKILYPVWAPVSSWLAFALKCKGCFLKAENVLCGSPSSLCGDRLCRKLHGPSTGVPIYSFWDFWTTEPVMCLFLILCHCIVLVWHLNTLLSLSSHRFRPAKHRRENHTPCSAPAR